MKLSEYTSICDAGRSTVIYVELKVFKEAGGSQHIGEIYLFNLRNRKSFQQTFYSVSLTDSKFSIEDERQLAEAKQFPSFSDFAPEICGFMEGGNIAGIKASNVVWPLLRNEFEKVGIDLQLWHPHTIDLRITERCSAINDLDTQIRIARRAKKKLTKKFSLNLRKLSIHRMVGYLLVLSLICIFTYFSIIRKVYQFPSYDTMIEILAREQYYPLEPSDEKVFEEVWSRRVQAVSFCLYGDGKCDKYEKIRIFINPDNNKIIGMDMWAFQRPDMKTADAIRGDYFCEKFFSNYEKHRFASLSDPQSYVGHTINIQSYNGLQFICKQFTEELPEDYVWLRWYFIKSDKW